MDQLSAHLDRGWDLVQRGDALAAQESAKRALDLDDQSPEAYNLLGYASAMSGDFEEAVEHYSQALALDDTYFEAMLNVAEIYIHPLADFERAVRMCDEALDIAEEDEEIVDALLLKFDALLGQNQFEAASRLCDRFPRGPFESSAHTLLVGRAYCEVGRFADALPLIEEAARVTPDNAEAQYYLGLIRDEQGDVKGATQAFLRCRELDLEAPTPPWSLTSRGFVVSVQRAVDALDPVLKAPMDNSELYVCELPGAETVVDGVDPRALLLLEAGHPPQAAATETDEPDATTHDQETQSLTDAPLRVFVYQRNIERQAGSLDRVESELSIALAGELRALLGWRGEAEGSPGDAPLDTSPEDSSPGQRR